MMSLGFWFAAGVCLFILCAIGAYKLGKGIGYIVGVFLAIVVGIWILEALFKTAQVLIVFICLLIYLALCIYCIYSILRQILHFSQYAYIYHIIMIGCICLFVACHFISSIVIYASMSGLIDCNVIKKK